jgi:hypothetical protein
VERASTAQRLSKLSKVELLRLLAALLTEHRLFGLALDGHIYWNRAMYKHEAADRALRCALKKASRT